MGPIVPVLNCCKIQCKRPLLILSVMWSTTSFLCQHQNLIRTDMLLIYFNIDAVTYSSLSLSNGEVSYSGSAMNGEYPVNTVASFTCNSGYALSGSESSTCETSGTWNEQDQMCNQGEVKGIWLKI